MDTGRSPRYTPGALEMNLMRTSDQPNRTLTMGKVNTRRTYECLKSKYLRAWLRRAGPNNIVPHVIDRPMFHLMIYYPRYIRRL